MPATTAINLNSDTPVAPDGCGNIIFQNDGGVPMASISAFDPPMIGDDGTNPAFSGNVPAPALGDAAAGKYLAADGTWSVPGSSGGFTNGNNADGYWVKDPVGHIHQWGNIFTDINSGELTITFPVPYTLLASVTVVVSTLSVTDRITFLVGGDITIYGFHISNNGSGGNATWIADGY